MPIPPRPMGWWAPVEEPELDALLGDLDAQLRYPLPEGTRIHRGRVSCYPSLALLHLSIPTAAGPRESWAFHAPGQLFPLTWSRADLAAVDESFLEVKTPGQAVEAVAFHLWALVSPYRDSGSWGERVPLVERWEDLGIDPAVEMDPEWRAEVEAVLRPAQVRTLDEAGRTGVFQVTCTVARALWLGQAEFQVSSAGVELVDMGDAATILPEPPVSHVDAIRTLVLVREARYTAQRFLRHLASGRPLRQARVIDPVEARGQTFPHPVTLDGVVFQHDVDLSGAVFENGLTLRDCVMEGRALFRDIRVKGDLDARGLRFVPPRTGPGMAAPDPWERVDLDAQGLEVSGSVLLQGLQARHVVTLTHGRIGGGLHLAGADIGPIRDPSLDPVWRAALHMEALKVEGDVDLSFPGPGRGAVHDLPARSLEGEVAGISRPVTLIRGGVAGRHLAVGGTVNLGGVRCDGYLSLESGQFRSGVDGQALAPDQRLVALGGLSLGNASVGGVLTLSGLWCGQDLNLANAHIRSSVLIRTGRTGGRRIPPAVIRDALTLSGLTAEDVEVEGADIGRLDMATGTVGRLFLQAGLEDVEAGGGPRARVRPLRVGPMVVSDLSVAKAVRFVGIHVGHPSVAQGTAEGTGYIRMHNVRCGGDLQFSRDWDPPFTDPPPESEWSPGGFPPTPNQLGTWVGGVVSAVGLQVEGRLILRNLHSAGRVVIRNCTVGQDLDAGPASWSDRGESGETRTACPSLSLEMTEVGGDADLSGLRVQGAGSESWVRARHLRVAGRLLFSSPRGEWVAVDGISPDPDQRYDAVIEGALDLSAAEAAHLVVSGSSFESGEEGVGISLERGRFRRLHILEPWPFRHDLSDVQVERWQIPTEHLLTFLERSHPFRRSTYIEIERVLRNEAQEAEADRVYRGMRRRAIAEAELAWAERIPGRDGEPATRMGSALGHLFRTRGSRLLGWIYGWGTLYWLPMLFVAFPTFLFSWGLFSQPQNVEATPVALVARGLQAQTGVRPGELGFSWGAPDGLWMALRYHVPVVPLGARGIWEPTNGPASLAVGNRVLPLPVSGEGYAFFIFLLHWIIWPLFLYGIGRKVIRDRA